MKKAFHSYHRLSKGALDALWKDGLIVPDANVLLNLYRYSERTKDELLRLFRDLRTRLWLPHQVGFEFHRSRLIVIGQQYAQYESLSKRFGEMIKALENPRLHPFLSSKLTQKLQRAYRDLENESTRKLTDLMALADDDAISDEITNLFDGRVGEPFAESELTELSAEGAERYRLKIPPGFKDDQKPPESKYGDLIIWKQILREAESRKKGVVFVTDDRKDDWWLEWRGKTIGPLPALREEFARLTGTTFHMYGTDVFMEYAGQYSVRKVDKEAIKEVKETQAERKVDVGSALQATDSAAAGTGALTSLASSGLPEARSTAMRSLADSVSIRPDLSTILGDQEKFRHVTLAANLFTPEFIRTLQERQKQWESELGDLASERARNLAEDVRRLTSMSPDVLLGLRKLEKENEERIRSLVSRGSEAQSPPKASGMTDTPDTGGSADTTKK